MAIRSLTLSQEQQRKNALVVSVIAIIGLALASGYPWRPPQTFWELANILASVIPVIAWACGLLLVLLRRVELGVQIGLVFSLLCLPLSSYWSTDVALENAVAAGVGGAMIAIICLPPDRARYFIFGAALAALASFALDLIGLSPRPFVESNIVLLNLLTAAGILALAVFLLWQFRSYSLRTKLIIAFVGLGALSAIGVAAASQQAIRSAVTVNAANDLQTHARAAALSIGITVDRNVDRLQTLSLDKRVQDEVALITDSYPMNGSERDTLLGQNAGRWTGANAQDPLIRNALNGALASSLRQFADVFQGNKELFITDSYGAVIAARDWQPQYNFANEEWWRIAYNEGRGSVYVGQPEFDAMLNENGIRMAIPIYGAGRGHAVGVLHSVFTLTALDRVLLLNGFDKTGKVDLLFPLGQILTPEGTFRTLAPDEFSQLKDGINQPLTTVNYRGAPLLSSQGVIGTSDDQPEPYLRGSAWRTIATVEPQEALSAIDAASRAASLAGFIAVGLAVLVGLGMAQFLTRPIHRLTATAEQVQSGDLAARAPVETGDEIGTLARTFNSMTSRLQETLAGLEQRVNERTLELSQANLVLQSNSAYLSALSDTSSGLFQRLELNDVLQAIVERAGALVGTQNGFVFLQEPGDPEIEMRVGAGLYDDLVGTRAQPGVGLAGTVWQTGQPMVIDDYRVWEGRLPGSRRDALRALIAVPLKRGGTGSDVSGETVGVIGLAYTDPGRKFGKTEIEILQRFAQLASIALDNARLYAGSQERVQELGALNSISRIVAQEADFNRLLERVGMQMCEIFQTDFGFIALRNLASSTIEFPFVLDAGKHVVIAPIEMGQGVTSEVIRTRQPFRLANATAEDWKELGAIDTGDGATPDALLSVPLISGEQVLGALSVQRFKSHAFTPDDERLLLTMAASVSVGIDNARLAMATQRQLQELAALNKISSLLTSERPLSERLSLVGRELQAIFAVSNAYIALYDRARDRIHIPFFREESQDYAVEPYEPGPDLISHIIRTRQPLVINDEIEARSSELGAIRAGTEGNQSYLGVPVMLGDLVLGVVALSDGPKFRFKDSDERLLSTIASALASAIQNSNLFRQTQDALQQTASQAERLRLLNDLSASLARVETHEEMLDLAGAKISAILRGDAVTLALLDASGAFLHVHGVEEEGTDARDTVLPVADTVLGDSLKQGAITHVPEIGVLQNGAARLVTQPGMRSALLVPLQQSDGKPLGILAAVSREPNHFSQQDQQLGRQVAVVLSSAIENRRLLEQTQQALAQTDTLYRVVREIASAPDLQELLRVTAGAMRLPFINRLVLYRLALDAAGEILSGRIVANWSNGRGLSPAAVGLELPLEQVMFVQPLFGAEPLLVDNVQTDGRLNSIAREITMLSSGVTIAALPLLVGDQRTGALLFEGDEPHSWSVEEQSFLTSLASAVAVAMERFRLFEETRVALNEARRSAERERESAELVSALNRRLTREGWQDYFAHLNSNLVVESAAQEHANGNGVPHETAEDAESHSTNGEGKVTFPISLRGEVIGEIELEPGDPAAISEDNLGLITHVAENLGVALDNARLVSETQRRVSELNALNQISTTITSQLEFETLLNVIGEQLRRIFNTENVYIALYDRATDMISLPYFVNDGKRVSVEPIRYGEGISSHIIRTREPLLINKYADARMGELGAKVFGNPARSFLGVPVFVGDEVTGVMTVQDMQHEDVFDESNLNLMQTIAATVGAALQNAQLYSAIKQEVVVRQRAEEEIKLSLREKEVLLKEIHHRVKNNLQIITSLLNLQSAQIKDPDAFGMFRESQARVRSMALIHEKLYQSKDLARIDFDSYVRDLLVYLFRSYAVNPDQIRPEIQEHSMFLGIDTAIPCGLIISELVTNALKYAFPDGKRGSLRLGVGPEDDGHLTLEVSDTGAGFKPGFNWRESDSLGLQLVSTLTAQLHGLVNVHSDASGTSFKITFPG